MSSISSVRSMLMNRYILTAFLFIIGASHSSGAGQIDASIQIYKYQGNMSNVQIVVEGPDLTIQTKSSRTWAFSFNSAQAIGVVDLKFTSIPAGFDSSVYRISIPFSWERKNIKLYATLANDAPIDDSAWAFLAAVSGYSLQKDSATFILNQRAKRIYRQRFTSIENGTRNPNKIDVRVVYWLLVTARELSNRLYVVPDDATMDAKNWLVGLLSTHPNLFSKDTVMSEDVRLVAAHLDKFENTLYKTVVSDIEREIASNLAGEPGCNRAIWLRERLRQMSLGDYASVTTDGAVDLRITTTVALCLTRKLSQRRIPVDDAEVMLGRIVESELDQMVIGATGTEKLNASARKSELSLILASINR